MMSRLLRPLLVAVLAMAAVAPAFAAQNGDVPVNTPESARRVITDLMNEFGQQYPNGPKYLATLDAIERDLKANPENADAQAALQGLIREATLANPLIAGEELIVILRKGEANRRLNSHTSDTIKRDGWDNFIAKLSNLTGDVKVEEVYRHANTSVMKHMDLDFSGEKIMFSGQGANGNWAIMEVDANGENLKELTPSDQNDVQWFDACYLPEEGHIVTGSTAGMQGLPCENGGRPMVNLYRVNTDTKAVRQLTFEQDSDWHPRVMENGEIMYLRWEYTDSPHYYTRILFHMNPDGTRQLEYWGSNSMFPTAYVHARPIPNKPSMAVGIVSGHHAKSETGRLMIIDRSLGRRYPLVIDPETKEWGPEKTEVNIHGEVLPKEVTGCVQEIPGWGRDVVGNIYDNQGGKQKYTFGTPWPLSDKYYLVSVKGIPGTSGWALALVDVFDNMTVILDDEYDVFEPILLAPRKRPPVLVDRTIPGADAKIFCTNIYDGRGLAGVPEGTVKELRVFAYHYGYIRSGGHESVGLESSWDIKRILGTVPVEEDGSFSFVAPPNTPIAIQPLDEDGAAVALMRSWFVGMPGETLSCNGCHEDQNEVTSRGVVQAGLRAPSQIKPWYGPARPFAYQTEVQPVLDKYCVGCHNDENAAEKGMISFVPSQTGDWRKDSSYLALAAYVRRPGPESDYALLKPMEYHASTSPLIQMFKKGHNNVQLDREAWDRLYTWVDLNAPYRGMWNNEQFENRRLELATLYAGLTDNPEDEFRRSLTSLESLKIEPIKPERLPKPGPDGLSLPNFPFEAEASDAIEVPLGDGMTMKFVRIPAGQYIMGSENGYADEAPRQVVTVEKPFWMGQTEVTNAQYKAFDPAHDTRYIDEHGKDHSVPGYIANHRDQPVSRITWKEAMDFCQWMSEKTGAKVTLPTESQWEWAARAGSDQDNFYGDKDTDFSPYANLADSSRRRTYVKWDGGSMIHVRRDYPEHFLFPLRDNRFTDKYFIVDYVKQYEPNGFGLYDIIGNVAEWTRSDYAPYPYKANDGRNAGNPDTAKVARGGSWHDRPKDAGSAVRGRYEAWQPVYNVGFRVIIEE